MIDPGQGPNGTLYVVSKVKLGPGSYQQQLHALDITTGLEQAHSPMTIRASVPGTAEDAVKGMVSFDPLLQHDRPALTLANGVVYLSFASHCDFQPYHGWILGYDETMMTQKVVFNTSANGDGRRLLGSRMRSGGRYQRRFDRALPVTEPLIPAHPASIMATVLCG